MNAPVFEDPPCAANPEAFYPSAKAIRAVRSARAVCLTQCPYTAQCLQLALDAGDFEGIFGGTTGAERRALTDGLVAA